MKAAAPSVGSLVARMRSHPSDVAPVLALGDALCVPQLEEAHVGGSLVRTLKTMPDRGRVMALWRESEHVEASTVLEAGGHEALVACVHACGAALALLAARALGYLACDADGRVAIVGAGGLTALLGLLTRDRGAMLRCDDGCGRGGTDEPCGCEDARLHVALWALGNLSAASEARESIPRDAVRSVSDALTESPSLRVKRQAARLLGNWALGDNRSASQAIRDAGALPALVACLRQPSDPWLVYQALCTLGNVVVNDEANRDVVREAGGMEPWTTCLSRQHPIHVRAAAAQSLCSMVWNDATSRDAFRALGGFELLAECVDGGGSGGDGCDDVVTWSLGLLLHAVTDSRANQTAAAVTVPHLVSCLSHGYTTTIRTKAAVALAALLRRDHPNRIAARDAGVYALLLRAMQPGEADALREEAVCALYHFLSMPYMWCDLDAAAGVMALASLLAHRPTDRMQHYACRTLRCLVVEHESVRPLVLRLAPIMRALMLWSHDSTMYVASSALFMLELLHVQNDNEKLWGT